MVMASGVGNHTSWTTVPKHQRSVQLLAAAGIILFSAVYFGSSIIAAWKSRILTDEVFVIWTLRAFPASELIDAPKFGGVPGAPPAYYLLLKGVCRVLGLNTLAMRVPSVIAFYLFLLSIFWLVRKHTSLPIAALAMALPCVTGAASAATMARPYALAAACFGVAAVLWMQNSSNEPRFGTAALIALVLAIAIGVYLYAVLLVVALGVAELTRSISDRRFRWVNWAALAAGGMSVFLWWPWIGPILRFTHLSANAPGFFAKPSAGAFLAKLQELMTGDRMLPVLVVFVSMAPICLLVAHFTQAHRASWMRPESGGNTTAIRHLDILAFSSLLLPIVTFVFALGVTGGFTTRYVFPSVLGLSILAVRALRHFPFANLVCLCLLPVITADFAYVSLQHARIGDPRIAMLSRTPEPLPILLGDASDFFELRESAPPPLRDRLVFAGMPAGFTSPDPEPELIAFQWKQVLKDAPIFRAEDWFAQTPRFYVLCTSGAREGMTNWLIQHAAVTVAVRESSFWLLEADVSNRRVR
jgi:hypothetical protein